jgi:D-alanine-D-alanine ligase
MNIQRMPRRNPRRVVVLYGAVGADAGPDEQDVLVEVANVRAALAGLGYQPVLLPLSLDLDAARRALLHARPAFVFNLVESLDGNGALIHLATSLLDSMALPYTGAHTEAMFLSSSKLVAKRMMAAGDVPTAPWWQTDDRPESTTRIAALAFPGPYIVKSVWEHASIGIDDSSVVTDAEKALSVLRRRRRTLGGQWFVERYIDGREFNIGLLDGRNGPQVLPIAEMRFVDFPAGKPKIVGYTAKWHDGSFEERNTQRDYHWSRTEPDLNVTLEALACRCWRLFGMAGYARVDVRVDAADQPWVLEINANPCLSPDAGFMAAATRAGLGMSDVVARIAETALAKPVRPVVPAPAAVAPRARRPLAVRSAP